MDGIVLDVILVVAWLLAGTVLALLRRREPLGGIAVLAGACAAVATGATAVTDHPAARPAGLALGGVAAVARPLALALLPAVGMHLVIGLPDGRLLTRGRRAAVATGYLVALAVGAPAALQRSDVALWLLGTEALAALAAAWVLSNRWYWRVREPERQRMQWFGSAATLAVGAIAVTAASRLLLGWPQNEPDIVAVASLPIPLALVLGTSSRLVHRIDRVLAATISLVGLCVVVVAVYLGVVLGLGRVPNEQEGQLLALSMAAAGICALLYSPVRGWLVAYAQRRVYGERRQPRTALGTFGSRMSREIPLDELLLQLAEALHESLQLTRAEVWTGSGGLLDRSATVPDLPPAHLTLGPAEQPVVAGAGVMGPAWTRIWLPELLEERSGDGPLRVAPVTHAGRLLGLIVVERAPGAAAFDEAEEQSVAQLARQIGLALHNAQLDSALQTSLEEVRRQAEELQASRKRIVAAGDAERRKLERNLHDGAQQRLVALAVKIRLVQKIAGSDGARTREMLQELGDELKDAVTELRSLAHGIYPPLLMDRGLGEALRAAAGRAALPTSVDADGIGRYPQEIEAAAYFCCLEALQNAGKHAGDGATATVRLREDAGALLFEVDDDGPGFDPSQRRGGAGFVNMSDRLGSVGGALEVESRIGHGTQVRGRIPLAGRD